MMWKIITKDKLEATMKYFSNKSQAIQWYAMASEVILTTLSPGWWKENCTISAKNPDIFLDNKDNTRVARFYRQDRIIHLGHFLYLLRNTNGFKDFVDVLKTGDSRSCYWELNMYLFSFYQ